VAEKTGLLVGLTGKCERLWGVNVGGPPVLMNAVTPADGGAPVIIVALEDGTMKVLDGGGILMRLGHVNGTPTYVLKLPGGSVILGCENGEVAVFGL